MITVDEKTELNQDTKQVSVNQNIEQHIQETCNTQIKPLDKTKDTAIQGIELLNSMTEIYDNVTIKGDNKYYTLKYNDKTFAIINLQAKSLRIRFYKESLTEELLNLCRQANGKSVTLKASFNYKGEQDTDSLVKMVECGVKYMQHKVL